jgi:hypothetical protein
VGYCKEDSGSARSKNGSVAGINPTLSQCPLALQSALEVLELAEFPGHRTRVLRIVINGIINIHGPGQTI